MLIEVTQATRLSLKGLWQKLVRIIHVNLYFPHQQQ